LVKRLMASVTPEWVYFALFGRQAEGVESWVFTASSSALSS
jgi:hypothetical protein